MIVNKIGGESQKVAEIPYGAPGIKVEIKPMASVVCVIETGGHEGPLRFSVEFLARCEGQLTVVVDREQKALNELHSLWVFRDNPKMFVYPRTLYDPKFVPTQKGRTCSPNIWQPEHLYLELSSQTGCQFNLIGTFTYEEKQEEKKQKVGSSNNDKKISNKLR